MKSRFPFINFIGIQKFCIIVHRKELVNLSFNSPPLQFTFNKIEEKRKASKSETCIFEDVGNLAKINV